jgi:hypothetical protein
MSEEFLKYIDGDVKTWTHFVSYLRKVKTEYNFTIREQIHNFTLEFKF